MGRLGNTFNDVKWPLAVLNVGNILDIIDLNPFIVASAYQCLSGVEPTFYNSFVFALACPLMLLASITIYTKHWQMKYARIVVELERSRDDVAELSSAERELTADVENVDMEHGKSAATTDAVQGLGNAVSRAGAKIIDEKAKVASGGTSGSGSGHGTGGGGEGEGGISRDEIETILSQFDQGKKGFLTKDEFHKMLCDDTVDDQALGQAEFDQMYIQLDKDGDGTLNLDELCFYFQNAQDPTSSNAASNAASPAAPVAEGGFQITTSQDAMVGRGDRKPPEGIALTKDEVAEYMAVFFHYDADNSGTLDPDELSQVLIDLDGHCDKEALALAMDEIDNDGNKELDKDEFLTFMSVHKKLAADEIGTAISKVKKDASDAYAKAWKNVLLVMFMVVPPSATKVAQFALCDQVEGLWLLRADIRRVCYDEDWWYYSPFFFAGFGVYIIGFPMFFWVKLYQNRKWIQDNPNDNTSMVFKKLGFLYMAYSPHCW